MRIYRIEYQLGSTASEHRTVAAAQQALERARSAARRAGDRQAIAIRAYDAVPTTYGRELIPVAHAALQLGVQDA
jgi:hypothetical protein